MIINEKIYSDKILLYLLSSFVLLILFIKFFIFQDQIPLHDEVTAIQRYTEIKNFLRKDGVNNHTLISIYGTIIRTVYGFDLLLFRLISFISFAGIVILFNKLFKNLYLAIIFFLIIYSSNFLFNAIYTFRGYYIYSFLSCLSFFLLLKFKNNPENMSNIRLLLVCLMLMSVHAIYCLYIVIPIGFLLLVNNYNNKKFYINGIIFYALPVFITYIVFCFLDGFVMNNNNNLNINFLVNNINDIFIENIKTGFYNIFAGQAFLTEENNYKSIIKSFLKFYYGEDPIYTREVIFLFVYISSFLILIYKIKKGYDIIDYSVLLVFIFFFILDKTPFIRVHSGTIYYCIFYIFNFVGNSDFLKEFFIKLIKYRFYYISLFLILTLFLNPDIKWQETKPSVDKINTVLSKNSCIEANNELNDYEIWITVSIFPYKCSYKYNFDTKKNILY
tara:strand:+ start:2117 stop:3451 length:1335 start_codon:yes stop_codon:yes gene_type:complete